MEISIINYGMNNLYSVQNACYSENINSIITDDHDKILNSKIAILPGVGAFQEAIYNIKKKKLDKTILDFINSGKPFFGICLGMQLLFDESEEFGFTKGLGVFEGKVVKFKSNKIQNLVVPHVGWNKVTFNENNYKSSVMKNNFENDFMYFVHSFHVLPEINEVQLTSTNYGGINFCSAIKKDNITAFQFHPEKSGIAGKKIFKEIKKLL